MDKTEITQIAPNVEQNEMLLQAQLQVDKIDKAYSSEPWWYDLRGFLILTFSYRSTLPKQIRLFANNIAANHLEVAIGTGTLFEMILLYRRFKKLPLVRIMGFDYAERMLAGAKKRFKNEKQVSLIRADAGHLQFEKNSFDSANIANSIHCLPAIEHGIAEVYRVLKPGGQFAGNCLLEPKGRGFLDQISKGINNWGIKKGILHRTYFKSEIIELLLKVGFEITFQEVHGNSFNFIAKKPFRLN